MKIEYEKDDGGDQAKDTIYLEARPRRNQGARPYPNKSGFKLSVPVQSFAWMVAGISIFYGLEMFGALWMKPSTWAGTHQARLEAEMKSAELQQQAKFTAYEKQVELVVRQNDEQWKTRMQNVSAYYTAAYDRAKIYAEATTRINQQFITVRMQTKQQLLAPDIAVANLSRFWGYGKNYLAPGSGDRAMAYSEELGEYVLDELTKTAMSGTAITIEGWDTSLPPPSEVQDYINEFEPVAFPPAPDIWRYNKDLNP